MKRIENAARRGNAGKAEGPDRSVYGTSPVEVLLPLQSALRSFPPNDEEKP
jgi:hypothetical protein